jgi:hypothetical protein
MRLWWIIALLLCPAWLGCGHQDMPVAKTAVARSAAGEELVPPAPEIHDRGQTADDPLPITWQDLDIPLEPDSVYESWMLTTRARAVTERYVRITGFMYGGIAVRDGIREFPLLRENECPFGAGGQAHHAVQVNLQGKLRTHFTTEPVTVEGYLSVDPFNGPNGKTWSLYHLEGTKIR